MRRLERLGLPAWLLALILVLFPVLDLLPALWPLQPGEIAWRFSVGGLVSRIVLMPLIGLALAYAAAVLLDQVRVLKVLAVLNALLVLVLLAGVMVFVMDASQMRLRVAPDALDRFDVGAATALVKYGLGCLILLGLLVSEWRTASTMSRRREAARSEASAALLQRAKRRTAQSEDQAEVSSAPKSGAAVREPRSGALDGRGEEG